MAFTEFYMQTTGSDLNAGSTNADASSVTSTNGDWDNAAANRFTAASGTPFSGVSIGDWASIYLDAATLTVFISQVTAVNAGGASIDVSTTIKFGTKPAAGATGRTCKIGGAWGSLGIFLAGGALNTTTAISMRINVKAGTYANTTTNRSFRPNGTTAFPVWWRGYNTTIGDIDTDNTLTKPVLSMTTGQFAVAGAATYNIFSNLDFQGATTAANGLFSVPASSAPIKFDRCRFINTAANAAARALSAAGTGCIVTRCYFSATTTAGSCINISGSLIIQGCYISGGIDGVTHNSASVAEIINSVIASPVTYGINVTAAGYVVVIGCTIYNAGSHGIRINVVPAGAYALITNCILANNGGYGISNTSGADTGWYHRVGNDFYSNTSGTENGFGDTPSLAELSESSSPFTTPGTNFTPLISSSAKGGQKPGTFENTAFTSYGDSGAVQRQESAAGNVFNIME